MQRFFWHNATNFELFLDFIDLEKSLQHVDRQQVMFNMEETGLEKNTK